jgi:hypothetical protein
MNVILSVAGERNLGVRRPFADVVEPAAEPMLLAASFGTPMTMVAVAFATVPGVTGVSDDDPLPPPPHAARDMAANASVPRRGLRKEITLSYKELDNDHELAATQLSRPVHKESHRQHLRCNTWLAGK